MDNDIIVIKLTGKVFENIDLITKYINIFNDLIEKYRLVIITGGGKKAREYIDLARKIGVNSNYWLDLIGISVARLNSYLLISKLYPKAYHKPVENLDELHKAIASKRLVFMGGLIPGQSTAAVAIEVSEALNVDRIVVASAIDHVYDRDPSKYVNAKKFKEIEASKLKTLLQQKILPGEYALIDVKALDLAIRSNITIYITYYAKPENIIRIIENNENPGTIIHPR